MPPSCRVTCKCDVLVPACRRRRWRQKAGDRSNRRRRDYDTWTMAWRRTRLPGVRLSSLYDYISLLFSAVPKCDRCVITQVYGYHDCAMDILTCVTDMFAVDNSSSRYPPLVDHSLQRRYRPPSPPRHTVEQQDSTWPRRQNTVHLPPVKPASLPSLQLSDDGRRTRDNKPRDKKRRARRWANSSTATSDADAEFSDVTSADFTQ